MSHDIIPCETPEQVEAACCLLEAMYPDSSARYVRDSVQQMRKEGWILIGIFAEDGSCMATILYRIATRLFFGKYMQLDALFVDPQYRRNKLAEALLDWLEEKARAQNCQNLVLESTAENATGHRFFFKQGYSIRGYVFRKPLDE